MPYQYETLGPLENNVGQLLSDSSLLDVLWRNVGIIDMRSYRRTPWFDSTGDLQTGTIYAYPDGNIRIWNGWIEYRTGLTSLQIEGWAGSWGNEKIKVYVNGAAQPDVTPAATWSQTVNITTGYSAGQLLYIEVWVIGTRPNTAWHLVGSVFATPISYTTTWPGVPTFTSSWDAAKFIQLQNAVQWCWERIGIVPRVARRQVRYINGPFKRATDDAGGSWTHGNYPLAYGAITRNYANDILRVQGQVYNQTSTGLKMNVYINGTLRASLGPWSANAAPQSINLPISLSGAGLSVGSRGTCKIEGQVVDPGPNTPPTAPWLQSKWSFSYIGTEPDGSNYPYATMPTAFSDGFLAADTIRDRLNALSTIVTNVYNRIRTGGSTDHVFNRVSAMRAAYSYGNPDATRLARSRPHLYHGGSQLTVRGRGVKAMWGPVTIPPADPTRPNWVNFDAHTFGRSASIIDGNTEETKTLYLDTIENLDQTTSYELDGDVYWAAEYY